MPQKINSSQQKNEKKESSTKANFKWKDADKAIIDFFFNSGEIRPVFLWAIDETAFFRANWWNDKTSETKVVKSAFVQVDRTPDGFVVLDCTVEKEK